MSGVTSVAQHAAELPAIVERARALLDAGDVAAARLLAGEAYARSKRAAKLARRGGERFAAAEQLIAKAHRLQGEALLIEARAKIRLADEWDAAEQAGHTLKGRPKSVPDGNAFSAAEAGLSRKEIHDARKLRDAERASPGIIEQAIAGRLEAKLEPSRAAVSRGIGTRSAPKAERGLDFYRTAPEAVWALLALESFSPVIWEPACGDGAISRELERAGHDLVLSDIADRGCADRHGECQAVTDFLQTDREWLAGQAFDGADHGDGTNLGIDIVTNPPFGLINGFVAHALRVHRPAKLALLLNLNAVCGADDSDRNFWLDECPPARIHVFSRRLPMMHRDGWDGPRSGSQMNTAWFVWERLDSIPLTRAASLPLRGGGAGAPVALRSVDARTAGEEPAGQEGFMAGRSERRSHASDTTETRPYGCETRLSRVDWKQFACPTAEEATGRGCE